MPFPMVDRWWTIPPERADAFHTAVPALLVLTGAYALASVFPEALLPAVPLAAGAAWVAARRTASGTWASSAGDALLAVSAFAYPVFLGGRGLTVATAAATLALLAVRWCGPTSCAEAAATARAFAAALGAGLGVSALQFFLPVVWGWTTGIVAAVAVGAIAVAARAPLGSAVMRAAIPALLIAEVTLVLRVLPTHWVINGVTIAFAFAAVSHRPRALQWAYAALAFATLLVGAVFAR